ncbi:MAG: hypothetical protein ACRCXZ_06155 [Patescibacteria group bacterium]
MKNINLVVRPRESFTRREFAKTFPPNSIALDGVVSAGPYVDHKLKQINFDHHTGVLRSATMSTCAQVYLAIKQGLFDFFDIPKPIVVINDCDQDTSMAVWLLENRHMIEGIQSNPLINRLLSLTDKLDITAGAFPMSLSNELTESYAWTFRPYTDFRKSGQLALANIDQMLQNLELTMHRITDNVLGQTGYTPLDTRHCIFWEDETVKIYDELGGSEARYHLYSKGMKAHIALVTTMPNGRNVWSIGRRSVFVRFDLCLFYQLMNEYDRDASGNIFLPNESAGGSDTVGGSSRLHGSKLEWQDMKELYLQVQKSSTYPCQV